MAYKWLTKGLQRAHNDLINAFTYKFEKYSQIVDVLERLREVEIDVYEEIKQSALNIKDLFNLDDMDDNMDDHQTTKDKLLVE